MKCLIGKGGATSYPSLSDGNGQRASNKDKVVADEPNTLLPDRHYSL